MTTHINITEADDALLSPTVTQRTVSNADTQNDFSWESTATLPSDPLFERVVYDSSEK